MCYHGVTDNVVYGRTNNPYDLDCTPQGSSGGEAAIIAAGGSPIGIGTDIGGSIRGPSHFCGIAGIKPTSRRVPETGMLGAFPPFVAHWNGIGPMSRHIEDLALVLSIISGPDGRDARTMPVEMRNPTEVQCGILKVAFFTDDGFAQPTAETIAAVEKTAKCLRPVCATVVEDRPQCFAEAMDIWAPVMIPSWAAAARYWQREYARMADTHVSKERFFITEWLINWLDHLEESGNYTPEHHQMLEVKLERYQQHMLAHIQDYDVIVTPVMNFPAGPHPTAEDFAKIPYDNFIEFIKTEVGAFCMAHNLTGWPSVVVRAGTSPEGLPIGVQIVAKPWREDVALAVAKIIEEKCGGWQPPVSL